MRWGVFVRERVFVSVVHVLCYLVRQLSTLHVCNFPLKP